MGERTPLSPSFLKEVMPELSPMVQTALAISEKILYSFSKPELAGT
jgi:hypothetical protein